MQNRRTASVLGLFASASMILAACGTQAPPVVQTVVVEKQVEVEKVVEKEVEKVVEKQVEVVKEVVATSAPEWTTPHPILADVRVRQAIAHCSDRDALIASVYDYVSDEDKPKLRMDTFMPRTAEFYAKDNPNIIDYKHDITGAGKLLDDAGWKLPEGGTVRQNDKGEPLILRFTTTNAQFRQTWAAVFERQMAACGIVIQRSHIPGSIWFGGNSGLRRRDFDLGAFAWVGETEPPGASLYACDQIPTPANNWEGQNYMGWCNEKASAAIKAGNNTLDRAERIKQYAIVQEEFTKDMISLPLFQRNETAGFNKALQGFKANSTEYYSHSAPQWDLGGKDTAVIALTQEPASMFGLIESAAVQRIAAILVDPGCFTQYDYGFQPAARCMDKFPSIGDGATNDPVEPKDGDKIVDANGNVAQIVGGKAVSLDEEGKATDKVVKVKNEKGEDVDFAAGVKMLQIKVTHTYKPLKWSDGEALKAADFALGYKVTCAKDSGAVTFFVCDRTAGFEATDKDGSVETVTTYVPGYQNPTYFLPGGFGWYPAHQVIASEGANKGKALAEVPTADFQKLPEITETPLGTGPYVLTKWTKGQNMTYEANPNYGADVKVKKIIIQFFGDTTGAVAALLAGDVDVVGSETLGAGAEAKAVIEAAAAGKISAENIASATWEHIDFNLNVR